MERKESKDRVNIILTFLDLFPSLPEIDENNEGITITFQNSSFSYNLSELIKSLDELLLPNQIPNQIIKVNLLKNDNIYATGSLTIKNGEQWVTFSYEHKKKSTNNFALSLIDCIKIKFFCKMDYVSNMENANNFIVNSDIPKSDNNLLIKPSPKKLYNNLTSKKQNGHVTSSSGNMGDYMDSLHTEESKISKILENISSELRYNDNNNLNNTTLPISNKKSNKNNLIKSENLSEFNHLAASSGIVGKDFKMRDINKTKNITKFSNNKVIHKKRASNKLWNNQFQDKEKEKDKQKSNNNNTLNKTAYTSNNKNFVENNKPKADNLKRNRSKNMIENQNKQAKKEKHTKSMTNDLLQNSNQKDSSKKIKKEYSSKNIIPKKDEEINEDDNNNIKENEYINNKLINQISQEIKDININSKEEKIYQEYVDDYNYEDDLLEQNGFSKKLEDFKLMYNDEYLQSINQEDYSLEIELFLEKLIELIMEYHLQIEEKEIEYQLIKNIYNKNIHLLSEQNKLNKKLQLLIEDIKIKEKNSKSIINIRKKNKINNITASKAEVKIFKFLLQPNQEKESKDNKEKLKKILKNILSKPKNKNIINKSEKIMKWIKNNMDKVLPVKDKGNKRIVSGKIQKKRPEDKDKGKFNKKRKNINNTNNTPPQGKNKFNKK